MSGNEVSATDQHVRQLLLALDVDSRIWEQGDGNPELRQALRGGSKSQNPLNPGKPEFAFVSGDHLVIIEDKRDHRYLSTHDDEGELDLTYPARANYAANGAVHYAMHIQRTSAYFPSIFAIGVTGDSIHLETECYHVSDGRVKRLPTTEEFSEFDKSNVQEFYRVSVKGELPQEERDIRELKLVANRLHDDLRTFASVSSDHKAGVISAILLALHNPDFSIGHLRGERAEGQTDGWKIWRAASAFLDSAYVDDNSGNMKRGTVKDQWAFIRDNSPLNRHQERLGGTPLKKFAQTLDNEVLSHISEGNSFDVLGSFYGEFVKYGNSDGAELGIVLTPHHISSLMAELIDVSRDDFVLDPCAGTASFLISAMNRMVKQAGNDQNAIEHIKSDRLHGIELQGKLYSVGVTNMILRGDGKAHFHMGDMFHVDRDEIRTSLIKQPGGHTVSVNHGFNKCLMNPPYSQAKNEDTGTLSEWHFINRALSLMNVGGRLAVIIPVSIMTNKRKNLVMKRAIYQGHTLEAVITMNKQTFYPVGTNPAIAIFTANKPHPSDKKVKFVNFTDDGMTLLPHIGLVNDGTHRSKRDHLLKVMNGDIDESTAYIVKSTIDVDDEWLHSYFYFNEYPPSELDFETSVADYLAFQFDRISHGRADLFKNEKTDVRGEDEMALGLGDRAWRTFKLGELHLTAMRGRRLKTADHTPGNDPYISSTGDNNGVANYVGNSIGVRRFSNCITVANSGSVGAAFYHPYEFVASDHVTTIAGGGLTKYMYLFLKTCIEFGFQDKYSFNREISDTRIAREVVLLPVDGEGNADWIFMDAYMRKLEDLVLERSFSFFSSKNVDNANLDDAEKVVR